jgi:hypothetical protein
MFLRQFVENTANAKLIECVNEILKLRTQQEELLNAHSGHKDCKRKTLGNVTTVNLTMLKVTDIISFLVICGKIMKMTIVDTSTGLTYIFKYCLICSFLQASQYKVEIQNANHVSIFVIIWCAKYIGSTMV